MRVGEIRENKAMSGLRIKGLGEEIATLANLPWDQSLENWPEDEVLTGMRGISRHVVRLIRSNPNKSNSEMIIKINTALADASACSKVKAINALAVTIKPK